MFKFGILFGSLLRPSWAPLGPQEGAILGPKRAPKSDLYPRALMFNSIANSSQNGPPGGPKRGPFGALCSSFVAFFVVMVPKRALRHFCAPLGAPFGAHLGAQEGPGGRLKLGQFS